MGRPFPLAGALVVASCVAACGGGDAVAPTATAAVSERATLSCTVALGDCASVMEGQTVTFLADPGSGASGRSVSLDFGDGTTSDLGPLVAAARVPHTYARIGVYTARLNIAGASTASAPTQVVRVDSLVTASIGATALGGLNVVATADVEGAPVTRYEWLFDPSAPALTTTQPQARFTYESAGWKAVVMHATLADGRVVTASSSVVVE